MRLYELFGHENKKKELLLEVLVLSSWIWDISWVEDDQTIRMITRNKKDGKRKTYVLHGLTEEIAKRWIQSNSKGKFWHRLIKHIITPGPINNTPVNNTPVNNTPVNNTPVDNTTDSDTPDVDKPTEQPMSKEEAKRKAKRKAQRNARKITRRSSKR